MATKSFKGVVGGVTYTDPTLFEKACKALGYRRTGRTAKWKVGTAVGIRLADGSRVEGQVWAPCDVRNWVWVALDDGRYARVNMQYGDAEICNGLGQILQNGRVAA